jgi:chromosomal replication initiator protein
MASPDREVWTDVLVYLRRQHPGICRQWFEEIEPVSADGGVMRLRAGSDVHRRYLERECTDRFAEAAQTVTGQLMAVRFLGPDDPTPPGAQQHASAQAQNRYDDGHASHAPANGRATADAEPASDAGQAAAGHVEPKDRAHVGGSGIASSAPPVPPAPSAGSDAMHAGPARRPVVEPSVNAGSRSQARTGGSPAYGGGYRDSLVINPDYTFDQFVVGPENRLAHAAAVAVADAPGAAYNPLFIHGGVGLGKSHLLQAICLRLLEHKPAPEIHYTSCEGFSTEYFDAVQAGEMNEFRHRFRDVDLLVIDDIHFLAQRERTQEEFFHTFNALYQHGKQIVLSSDAPPHEIPDLEARLVSRFQSGLVVQINPPGYETRVQIAKRKARIRNMELPDDVACYIAAKIDSNIREIEGAITKVQMQHIADRAPVSLDLARAALDDTVAEVKPEVTITSIIDAVVGHYGVKLTDLQSKRRQKSIAHPRQVCMYLARRHTRYSLEEIGGYFGGRDHTTVMHAVKQIDTKRKADEDFGRILDALERRFGGGGE